MDKNFNDNNNNNNNAERFAKLSEKISNINKNDNINNNKNFEKIENKINEVENNFNNNLDTLENKYNILKEEILKFSKLIDDDKSIKEKAKNKNIEDLKNFEQKIKIMLNEERDYLKEYVDNAVKKIENLITKYDVIKKLYEY